MNSQKLGKDFVICYFIKLSELLAQDMAGGGVRAN